MASPASRSGSALPVNQGHQRENGTERTSATAVMPASLSKPTKRSAARLEWPMVKRSQAADRVIGSVEFLRFVPFSAPPDRAAPRSSFPNVNGNRALAFVVVLHLTPRTGFDRRARAGGCHGSLCRWGRACSSGFAAVVAGSRPRRCPSQYRQVEPTHVRDRQRRAPLYLGGLHRDLRHAERDLPPAVARALPPLDPLQQCTDAVFDLLRRQFRH